MNLTIQWNPVVQAQGRYQHVPTLVALHVENIMYSFSYRAHMASLCGAYLLALFFDFFSDLSLETSSNIVL